VIGKNARPYAIACVPEGEGIRVKFPFSARIEAANLAWEILRACNGVTTVADVSAQVQTQLGVDAEVVDEAIEQLSGLGVLVDSSKAFRVLHHLTKNPAQFANNLTLAEGSALAQADRLPVKPASVTHRVEQREGSGLATLQAPGSCRGVADRALSPDALAHILVSGYRVPRRKGDQRSIPSAGALYPLKLYAILTRDHGDLSEGYYEYDPERRQLGLFGRLDEFALEHAFNSEPAVYGATAIVVIAADMERQAAKYGNRAYRFMHLEAGAAAYAMQLAAVEEGLGSLIHGGFLDDPLARELGMNDNEAPGRIEPLIAVALGHPAAPTADMRVALEALSTTLTGPGKPLGGGWARPVGMGSDALGFYAAVTPLNGADGDDQRTGGGTAPSQAHARIKSLAEAYERYAAGLVRVDVTASARELTARGERWLDPRRVAPLTPAQYERRPHLQPFSEERPLQWVAGADANGQRVLLVVDTAFYPIRASQWDRKPVIAANSSGMAAFTDEEEATRRALAELIERHGLMRHWYTRTAPRRVPKEELPYHWQRRIDHWQARGHAVHVLDISQHGVPVVEVVAVSDEYPAFVAGAAASLTAAEHALQKAFQEAELSLMSMRARPQPDPIAPADVVSLTDHRTLYAQPEYAEHVRWLWSGELGGPLPRVTATSDQLMRDLDAVVVRVGPTDGPLHVVRVLSEHLIPLSFGPGGGYHTHPSLNGRASRETIELPHYFA
jgi:thiazole/oxazole-forming peptide maturase SagD family component